jgi:hypothetical protein
VRSGVSSPSVCAVVRPAKALRAKARRLCDFAEKNAYFLNPNFF